jgi:hypothetical protein
MNWDFNNGVHSLEFTTDDFNKMKNGAIYTIKTRRQELIVVKCIRD